MPFQMIHKALTTLVIVVTSLTSTVNAQEFPPKKTITIVVGFAAGGSADSAARVIAKKLSEDLGQNVIVDNKPGAGGNIAHAYTATAPTDGSVILFGSIGPLSIAPHLMKLPYDPQKDLAPLTMGVTFPNVLVVIPELGVKNFKEYIAMAKKNPGKITFASTGSGSASHLQGELLNVRADIDTVHVPYKGVAPSVTDLLAGHVDIGFAGLPTALPHIQSGALKALGLSSKASSSAAPNIPPLAKTPGLQNFDLTQWFGVYVPSGTPNAIAQKIQKDIVDVLRMPEVKDTLEKQGAQPGNMSMAEFQSFSNSESKKFGAIVKTAKIEP